jgi:outer membrane lipoprotein-sorting protein
MPDWRWGAVAAGVAALVVLPLAVGALPAQQDRVLATDLLAWVNRSGTVGYSGYAEAFGGLSLPLTEEFSSVTDLLGERTRLRVWWRGDRDWRVDTVDATGETGLHRDRDGVWTWNYERNTALLTSEPPVRLPRSADLDPAGLGRRLLSEARPAEVTRLPDRRVAGRSAPGLRLRPADPGSTVERVDVWVDSPTGLPLRVEVWAAGGTRPVVETAYLDFSPGPPAAADTAFDPPASARVSRELNPDLAAAINVFSPAVPPASLAGLPLRQRAEGLGSVGTYGTGLTVLVAVPLPGRISGPLADQLAKTPGVTVNGSVPLRLPDGSPVIPADATLRLAVGPLTLLLADPPGRRSWLLTGTVTAAALDAAAAQIAANPPLEERR